MVIVSKKGGVGKTSLALNLAVAAELAGHAALIVDLDPQASAAAWSDSRAATKCPSNGGTPLSHFCPQSTGYKTIDSARVKFMYLPNETRRVRRRSTMPSSARVVGLSSPGWPSRARIVTRLIGSRQSGHV